MFWSLKIEIETINLIVSRNRPMMISRLEEYFREKLITVQSKRLIEELKTFIWKGHKAEASEGYNDDLVMAFCIGIWIRDTALRIQQENLARTKATLMNFRQVGAESVYIKSVGPPQNPFIMNLGGGKVEKLDWLL